MTREYVLYVIEECKKGNPLFRPLDEQISQIIIIKLLQEISVLKQKSS